MSHTIRRPSSFLLLLALGTLLASGNAARGQTTVPASTGSPPPATADVETAEAIEPLDVSNFISGGPETWTSPRGLSSALQIMLLLTVLSLAPALILMTTSFVRILVVLSLLRQAIGTQNLPPSQVITSLAMFLSLLIMSPVWAEVYQESIYPYTQEQVNPATGEPYQLMADRTANPDAPDEAWERGVKPIRRFMSRQIEAAGNSDDVWLFYQYLPEDRPRPETYDDVPLEVLLPAFMLSELKTAFLMGFQIYLPFLIIDVVVASVTISMGMMMLPPSMISLPFKLLLFVLVDGWSLVVGMLLHSFAMTF